MTPRPCPNLLRGYDGFQTSGSGRDRGARPCRCTRVGATGAQGDCALNQMHPAVKEVELDPAIRFGWFAGNCRRTFNYPGTIDNPRQAIGQHPELRTDPDQQKSRCNCQTDGIADVSQLNIHFSQNDKCAVMLSNKASR